MIPLLCTLLLAQDPQPADKKWTVSGSVVNALTGEVLRKALVALHRNAPPFSAMTDAEGKFSIEGTGQGEFQLHASRRGFLDFVDSRNLKVNRDVKGLTIKLTPQSVLAGHVVDEDGDPVANGGVFVMRSIAGHVVFSQTSQTDADGYFVVAGLSAGRYTVAATNLTVFGVALSAAQSAVDYVRTYYPNSVTAEGAVPINLTAGVENRSLVIRQRRERVFRLRGRVTNLPKEYVSLVLSPRGNPWAQLPSDMSQIDADGKFEFTGILPGSYVVHMSQVPAETMFCRIPITVDRDIDDLTVDLSPGATITGSLKMEGSAKPPAHWPEVHFAGPESSPNSAIKEDGTFIWSSVPPDIYKTWLTPEDGIYFKSLRFNGQPASMTALDLTSDSGGVLEIILSANAAEISGIVRDKDGAPSAEKLVTLWRAGESPRSVQSSTNGSFRFGGLAPGEYRVAAWEEIEAVLADVPEFIDRFKSSEVTVKEGSKENIDVRIVSKSAIEQEVAKLQ
jgi:hypothetical protein